MARTVLTEQEKKKRRKKRIKIFIIILLILGIGAYASYKLFFEDKGSNALEVKVLDSIDEYGYTLSDRDSELYKEEYNKLKDILLSDKIDEKEYATQVAKMFVIDLYSISTKVNKYDIGGNEFYYSDKKNMYETKVMDTIYSSVQDDTYGDRDQSLPLVSEIEVNSVEEMKYTLDNEEVDAYQVKLTWKYETDLKYDDEGTVVVAGGDNIRWSVVDYQPTLKPKYDTKKDNN